MILMNEATRLRIFAFGVLPDHNHVDIARLETLQRRLDALVENGRANVRELIEGAADRQEQPVERDVIGNFRMAHCA